MKARLLLIVAGLAFGFALPTFAQQKETVDPQLIQKLDDTLNKKYYEAINNHDAAALGALYTEDGIFVTIIGPVYGRKAIEKWYEDGFKGAATQKQYLHDRSAFCPHVRARQFNVQWRLERD